MINRIGDRCIDLDVKIEQVPDFVEEFYRHPIPFSIKKNLKGIPASQVHDYAPELKNDRSLENLPEAMQKKIYEFQKQGITFGISNFGRILLGDEMGVGKTLQAIGIMYIYNIDWPLLIICPSSLKFSWRDEILQWIPTI